jgi:hypothetical protein
MKSHTEYLTFNIAARMAFENITPQVEEIDPSELTRHARATTAGGCRTVLASSHLPFSLTVPAPYCRRP